MAKFTLTITDVVDNPPNWLTVKFECDPPPSLSAITQAQTLGAVLMQICQVRCNGGDLPDMIRRLQEMIAGVEALPVAASGDLGGN